MNLPFLLRTNHYLLLVLVKGIQGAWNTQGRHAAIKHLEWSTHMQLNKLSAENPTTKVPEIVLNI